MSATLVGTATPATSGGTTLDPVDVTVALPALSNGDAIVLTLFAYEYRRHEVDALDVTITVEGGYSEVVPTLYGGDVSITQWRRSVRGTETDATVSVTGGPVDLILCADVFGDLLTLSDFRVVGEAVGSTIATSPATTAVEDGIAYITAVAAPFVGLAAPALYSLTSEINNVGAESWAAATAWRAITAGVETPAAWTGSDAEYAATTTTFADGGSLVESVPVDVNLSQVLQSVAGPTDPAPTPARSRDQEVNEPPAADSHPPPTPQWREPSTAGPWRSP